MLLCRALIRLGRAIVPSAYRDDWTREWQAELYSRAAAQIDGGTTRTRLELVVRCAGAVVHAARLRKEEWSLTVLLPDLRYAVRSLGASYLPASRASCVDPAPSLRAE